MSDKVSWSTTSSSFLLLSEETSVKSHSSLIGEVGWGCLPKDAEEIENKEKIKFIEYNRGHIDYAKENRKKSTKAEMIFWEIVKDRKFLGHKFRRQKVIWHFILDFYCSKLLLWIELDGWYHNDRIDYDNMRDSEIYKKWIKIIRYTNEDVFFRLYWVSQDLAEKLKTRTEELK